MEEVCELSLELYTEEVSEELLGGEELWLLSSEELPVPPPPQPASRQASKTKQSNVRRNADFRMSAILITTISCYFTAYTN